MRELESSERAVWFVRYECENGRKRSNDYGGRKGFWLRSKYLYLGGRTNDKGGQFGFGPEPGKKLGKLFPVVLLLLRYVVLPSSESTTSSPVAGTYRPLMVACGAQAS